MSIEQDRTETKRDVLDAASAKEGGEDAPKRRQILHGAREVFLSRGFDAASMGEIARAAGVSKGTLYVYFDNKETLFREMITELKRRAAERMTELSGGGRDLRDVLTRFATRLVAEMTDPDHIALVRMVVGATDRFPDIGRAFFDNGPAYGAARLAEFFAAQAVAGKLRLADPEIAAWMFLGMVNQPATMAACMAAGDRFAPEMRGRSIAAAVDMFLAAYGTDAARPSR